MTQLGRMGWRCGTLESCEMVTGALMGGAGWGTRSGTLHPKKRTAGERKPVTLPALKITLLNFFNGLVLTIG